MAYRIRNFDNLSVAQVNNLFSRGRDIGDSVSAGAAPAEAYRGNEKSTSSDVRHPIVPIPQIEIVDDELESLENSS